MPLSSALTSSVLETTVPERVSSFTTSFLSRSYLPARTVRTECSGATPVSFSVESYSQLVSSAVGRS
jgi:hypothetical protein